MPVDCLVDVLKLATKLHSSGDTVTQLEFIYKI
jgi:hypothetical protein